MPGRIEDYAMIGDCETAALVGKDGSIDWLCWPRFDSDACFAALLGDAGNGRWLIAPEEATVAMSRRYRGDTLILETRFETASGAVTLVDFMPLRDAAIDLVRIVRGEKGTVRMRLELVLRFGYGAEIPWVTQPEPGVLRAVAGPHMAVLRTIVPLHGEDMKTVSHFTIEDGETASFVLSYGPSHLPPPKAPDPARALAETEAFWTEWAARAKPDGAWHEAAVRSLVTLKALTYDPTGGIVAAPTTSLPERLGGIRNWDYRFCWLRDATLTLLALMNAGYFEEAQAWRNWLLRAVAGAPAQAQIMYGLAGERRLTEWEVPWLAGYEGSKPVRIGNAAADQLQLDVFGEVIDAFYQGLKGGLPGDDYAWSLQCALLKRLAEIWDEPDRGIWESRGAPRHYVYSKVMAWVAFDRGVRTVREFGHDGPVELWDRLRRRIHADVCAKGFDRALGSFVVAYGDTKLDASLLLIPSTGFLPPDDPRVKGTVAAIEKRLLVDGFVMRHDPAEQELDLVHGEGAFLACSFWLADAYVLLGRHDDATTLLDRLLALRNDVGLLAEEYAPALGRQLGNFPQAFSHIALINTVHNISRAEKPAMQRSGQNGKSRHEAGANSKN
jgi:GH15 family glucan-1,4-alpha-glucosidase